MRLTTLQLYRLDRACVPIREAFGWGTYLVGSAQTMTEGVPRDVDVRTILTDEDFDAMFVGRPALWVLICTSIGQRLCEASGLPVDYQIQRMTEANEKFCDGERNPIGTSRPYAALGDATGFDPHGQRDDEPVVEAPAEVGHCGDPACNCPPDSELRSLRRTPAPTAARVCCKTEIRTDEQRSAWSTYWNQTGRCLTCEVPVAGGITRIGSAAPAPPAEVTSRTIHVRILCRHCQADVTNVTCWLDTNTDRILCVDCHELIEHDERCCMTVKGANKPHPDCPGRLPSPAATAAPAPPAAEVSCCARTLDRVRRELAYIFKPERGTDAAQMLDCLDVYAEQESAGTAAPALDGPE